jgi:hypothetical protein
LTVKLTNETEVNNIAGYSDPISLNERLIAQRIKGTPGITG